MATHLCASCRHIEQTSPGQIFWRCRWHCEEPHGDVIRCHVQPWAKACGHWEKKEGSCERDRD